MGENWYPRNGPEYVILYPEGITVGHCGPLLCEGVYMEAKKIHCGIRQAQIDIPNLLIFVLCCCFPHRRNVRIVTPVI